MSQLLVTNDIYFLNTERVGYRSVVILADLNENILSFFVSVVDQQPPHRLRNNTKQRKGRYRAVNNTGIVLVCGNITCQLVSY